MMGLGLEITTPITPGDEVQTHILTKSRPLPASQIRHVFIRPSDVPGAEFDIESVRLVFRREHLAGIESGVASRERVRVPAEVAELLNACLEEIGKVWPNLRRMKGAAGG